MEPVPGLRHGEVTGAPHLLLVPGDAATMSGAAGLPPPLLLLLLLGGRAAFTVCRAVNAPRDGGLLPLDGQTDEAGPGTVNLRLLMIFTRFNFQTIFVYEGGKSCTFKYYNFTNVCLV